MMEPRCVNIEEAARYVGLEVSGYRAAVRRGIYPGPIKGTKTYDLRNIDRRIDVLSGISCNNIAKTLSPLEMWEAAQNGNRS